MPTYEYRCADGHDFELFQRMSDEPKADCPECGKPAERMLSAGAGFLFKGEGFYITDYRSEAYKKAAKAESGNGSGSGKSKNSDAGPSQASGKTSGKTSGKASGSKKDAASGGGAAKPKGTSSSTESS